MNHLHLINVSYHRYELGQLFCFDNNGKAALKVNELKESLGDGKNWIPFQDMSNPYYISFELEGSSSPISITHYTFNKDTGNPLLPFAKEDLKSKVEELENKADWMVNNLNPEIYLRSPKKD